MALTGRQNEQLDDIVAELKAVRRRCTVALQMVARLRDEGSGQTEQTEEVTSNEPTQD